MEGRSPSEVKGQWLLGGALFFIHFIFRSVELPSPWQAAGQPPPFHTVSIPFYTMKGTKWRPKGDQPPHLGHLPLFIFHSFYYWILVFPPQSTQNTPDGRLEAFIFYSFYYFYYFYYFYFRKFLFLARNSLGGGLGAHQW